MPCAFGTASLADLQAGSGLGPVHRRARPGVGGDHDGDRHPRVGALPGGGLRLRDQRGHAASAGGAGHRHRGTGLDPGRPGARPRARRDLPVQRPGRPGRPAGHRRRDPATWPRRAPSRSSGSASATSCWPPPSAPPPTSSPSVTTAATTRCAGCPPDGWRSPRRTTTSPWPPIHWAAPRSPTSISTTGSSRASAAGRPRCSACSTTPRPGPVPTMPGTCSRSSAC